MMDIAELTRVVDDSESDALAHVLKKLRQVAKARRSLAALSADESTPRS